MRAYARNLGHRAPTDRSRARLAVVATIAALLLMGLFAGVAQASSVSNVTVANAAPSAAAGARTVYFVKFNTSTPNGGLSRANNDNITVTFPSGTDITSALGNTSVVDVTNNNTAVGSCNKSGLVATCTLFSGTSIAAGDQVSIEFDGVINPSPPSTETVSVSTSKDTTVAISAAYSVVAGHQITQPQVTISSPSAAAGARTVYFVNFSTSSTGGLSRQGVSNITVTFPTGTDITSALGNTSVVDVTNNNTAVGSCSKSGLVATCTLFSGTSIAAGDQVSIEFDGVINPSSAGSQTVSVSTSSDIPAVTSASYTIVAGHQITQPQVTISSPTAAAGARTVYFVNFSTSATGGLSRQGVSNITVTFPTGTDITSALGNTSVVDVTNNNTQVGTCSKSGLVATCTLFTNATIAPTDQVSIEFDGVINPSSAGSQTLTVSTSSDTPPVTSASYTIVAGHQVTQPTVTISSPTAAAGARTVYFVNFSTSTTGGLSRQGVSNITVTFPTGTDITSALGNTSVVDVTNNNTQVGTCSKSGLVATCTLFTNATIAPTDQVSIEFDGVINPSSAGSQTLTVSTSSDTPPVTSASYTIVAGHQISQPNVTISSPSPAAGARTVYFVTFSTSSTGALSRQGVSNITVTFPTGTDITSALGNTSVVDVTNGNTQVGTCSKSGLVATCTLFTNTTIAATDQVSIEFDGVINPSPAGSQTLKVSTSSDTPQVTSASYTVGTGGQVSQPNVSLSNQAPSAAGVVYIVSFATSSPNGGLSRQGVSQIVVTFPTGTDITSGLGNTSVTDLTTSTQVGTCSKSGLVATCTLFTNTTIAAGHQVSVALDHIINPSTPSTTEMVLVKTSSDLPLVNSSPYSIGGAPPPPTITSISPTSGPAAGGTPVTISGTNLSGATVRFGATQAAVTSDNGTQIQTSSPPGSGTVDVTVTTAGGTSATSAADRFTYTSPPPPPPPSSPPAVTPSSPSTSSATSAAVSGAVNPHGLATTVVFQYGLDLSQRGPGSSTTLYDQSTAPQQVGAGTSNQSVSANLTNLIAGGIYHVRMVATNSAGTSNGPDQTFTTPKAAAPPPPVLGQTQNAAPVSGKTFILINGKFVPLTSATKIPSGSTIDALKGTLTLTSATGVGKKLQTGTFGGAVFKVTQTKGGALKGLTTLTLVNNAFKGAPSFATCAAKKGKALPAALSTKVLQLLHAKDNHGKFRSKGRYAAATTRGTAWSMADRCDGTLTSVSSGAVTVNDLVRHVNVTVRAHHSYLALAKPPKRR